MKRGAVFCVSLISLSLFITGCAKTEKVTDQKFLTMPNGKQSREGIPTYGEPVEIRLNHPKDGKTYFFVEIVSDEDYQKEKDNKKISRGTTYPNLIFPLTRQMLSQCPNTGFSLPIEELRRPGDAKFWIRVIFLSVPEKYDQWQEQSGLDRLLWALVGRPVDLIFGGTFTVPYLNARNQEVYVQIHHDKYYPFWILAQNAERR